MIVADMGMATAGTLLEALKMRFRSKSLKRAQRRAKRLPGSLRAACARSVPSSRKENLRCFSSWA